MTMSTVPPLPMMTEADAGSTCSAARQHACSCALWPRSASLCKLDTGLQGCSKQAAWHSTGRQADQVIVHLVQAEGQVQGQAAQSKALHASGLRAGTPELGAGLKPSSAAQQPAAWCQCRSRGSLQVYSSLASHGQSTDQAWRTMGREYTIPR